MLAALGYAVGRRRSRPPRSRAVDPVVVAAGSCVAASDRHRAARARALPASRAGLEGAGSLALLGLAGTGVAYILLFVLMRSAGPSRAILVTYTIPGVGVLYGWLLLGEALRVVSLVGLALILAGVALAGRGRRAAADRAYRPPVPSLD